MSKFKDVPQKFGQFELFPANVFELLPEDHDCFLFRELLQQLDTKEIEAQYSPNGQRAYHPRKIISILIYGYSHGVFSSRELEQRCNQDLSFMYMAERNCPNFRVLSDFRKQFHAEFKSLFKQTVLLAQKLGLVRLGHVSLDGSKFKANTSKHKALSYGRLKASEKILTAKVADLMKKAERADDLENEVYKSETGFDIPEDLRFHKDRLKKIKAAKKALEQREHEENSEKLIDDKKQISFADTDAKIMGKKGDFDYRYNAQICVDDKHQIIVEQHVNSNANDTNEVKESLQGLEEATGSLPEKMSLDNGYWSGENFEELESKDIDAYIAAGRSEKEQDGELPNSFKKINFTYVEEDDYFLCPARQVLPLIKIRKDGGKVYTANYDICSNCQYYTKCVIAKRKVGRSITSTQYDKKLSAMRAKMKKKSSKAVYARRKVIVEPVFGQIKNGGFRGFGLRGIAKVKGEFALTCMAFNTKKIVKACRTGKVRLKSGNNPKFG